MKRKFML